VSDSYDGAFFSSHDVAEAQRDHYYSDNEYHPIVSTDAD
jgi:hypothetical protein